ncbi:hypothetical protein GEMRC1_006118 [Eukaryota sp. GEM-RC1]
MSEPVQTLPPCTHSDTDDSDDAYVLESVDVLHQNLASSSFVLGSSLDDPTVIRQRLTSIETLRRYYKSQFRALKHQLRVRSAHYNQIRANHRLILRKKRHELAPFDSVDAPPQRPTKGMKKAHPYTPKTESQPPPTKTTKPSLVDAPEPSRPVCSFPPPQVHGQQPCTNFSMPFSLFCYHHVLYDSNQQLYTNCSAEGCSAPILLGQKPPLCPAHYVAAGGRNAAITSDPAIASAVEAHKQKDTSRQLSSQEKSELPVGDTVTYREKVAFIKDTVADVLLKRQKHRRTAVSRSMKRKHNVP